MIPRTTALDHPGRPATPWFNRQVIRACPGFYALHFVGELIVLAIPVGLGLIEKDVFDTITGQSAAGFGLWTLVAMYVALAVARFGAALAEAWGGWTFRRAVGRMIRHNLLAGLLRRPGALALPVAPGEAINRFRGDVDEVSDFPTWFPDVVGQVGAFVVAVWIMARINLPITLLVFLPLAVALFISRAAWARFHATISAERAAGDAVDGFLGETLGAVQAIKLAGAEPGVVARYRALNDTHRRTAVRVRLLWETISAISGVSATFGVAVTLLLAGRLMAGGSFTIGDFALFTSYLWFTTDLPSFLGTFVGDYQQQEIAIGRLRALVPEEPGEVLEGRGPRPSPRPRPPRGRGRARGPDSGGIRRDDASAAGVLAPQAETPAPTRGEGVGGSGLVALERLVVRGLTYRHPASGRGIADADLVIDRGSFVVVTGRIGSGKTTLLRALLGLLPRDDGAVLWNGEPVGDAAARFRPPRCAYVPQVPRLLSDTVRRNVALGLAAPAGAVEAAIRAAVFDPDVAALERGLETVVGPRGVRLSGGQIQRVAAARSLIRSPDLLVCDDLSSALDPETERILWDNLGRRGDRSYLVVSHRRPVLARADRVVVLRDGRVEAEGSPDDLLRGSPEFRRIWEGTVD